MIFAETEIAKKIIRIEIEIEKATSIEKNEMKIIQIIVISTSNLLLMTFSNDLIFFFRQANRDKKQKKLLYLWKNKSSNKRLLEKFSQ